MQYLIEWWMLRKSHGEVWTSRVWAWEPLGLHCSWIPRKIWSFQENGIQHSMPNLYVSQFHMISYEWWCLYFFFHVPSIFAELKLDVLLWPPKQCKILPWAQHLRRPLQATTVAPRLAYDWHHSALQVRTSSRRGGGMWMYWRAELGCIFPPKLKGLEGGVFLVARTQRKQKRSTHHFKESLHGFCQVKNQDRSFSKVMFITPHIEESILIACQFVEFAGYCWWQRPRQSPHGLHSSLAKRHLAWQIRRVGAMEYGASEKPVLLRAGVSWRALVVSAAELIHSGESWQIFCSKGVQACHFARHPHIVLKGLPNHWF